MAIKSEDLSNSQKQASAFSCVLSLSTYRGGSRLKLTVSLLKTFLEFLFRGSSIFSFNTFVVLVQSLSWVRLFATQWTAASQTSLSFTISWSLLKLKSIELTMPCNHLLLCCPLLFLPSTFPSIRVFSHELALCIRWPKYWRFSFSCSLPMDVQDWFPLGLTGLSPCCPRDSQESFPAPQFESVNSLVLSLLYGSTLTCVHDYWKNHSFDYMEIC